MPKCHTNPLVSASDKCDGSSLLFRRNGFCRCMESLRISSVSDVTCWGLPIIRSSVDHGVAFGKAGEGRANPESMIQAIKMAVQLV